MEAYFINLTNGLEDIQAVPNARFIRIQSTACEQKRWSQIMLDLSDDFLIHFCIGSDIKVYDRGARKAIPRAMWQGLEFVKYVLYKYYFDTDYHPIGRAKSALNYFGVQYRELDEKVFTRLKYYKRFVRKAPTVEAITSSTERDGDYDFYVSQLHAYYQ